MTDMTDGAIAPGARRMGAASDLYRAVWRWHFYAGLLVLPFMITLAVTGGLYLFRDEIDGYLHADLKRIEAQQATRIAPSALVAAALETAPGTAIKYIDPPADDWSTEITVQTPEGRTAVYLNQYSGQVLGTLPDRGTVAWTIRYLHSLRYFGPTARSVIEIVGGFTILLVATGIYLWWPRGQRGGVVSLRGVPGRRIWWRDLHAVSGIFTGGFT